MSDAEKMKREYENDVLDRVRVLGGDPDAVNLDRVELAYYDDVLPGACANQEVRCQQWKG